MKRHRATRGGAALLSVATFLAALVMSSPAAHATPELTAESAAGQDARVESEVSAILALNPGSQRIDTYSVQLDPGVIMTVPTSEDDKTRDVGVLGFGDCPWLFVCGWQLAGATGYRLQFTACGQWFYLENYRMPDGRDWRDKITSIYNAQGGTGATARFVDTLSNGTWFTVGTVSPGGQRANLALDTAPDGRSWNDRIDKIWACNS